MSAIGVIGAAVRPREQYPRLVSEIWVIGAVEVTIGGPGGARHEFSLAWLNLPKYR